MSDEITPALSAEEWAQREAVRASTEISALDGSVMLVDPDAPSTVVLAEGVPALMALANAALPDGDPRKLTREDVALIRGERFGGFKDDAPALWRAVDALAAKLAALLPPEPA